MLIKNSTLKAFAELCEKSNAGREQLKYVHITETFVEATNSYVVGFANVDTEWDLQTDDVFIKADVAKKLPSKGFSEITCENGKLIMNGSQILNPPEQHYPNMEKLRQPIEESNEANPKLCNDYLKQVVSFVNKFDCKDSKLEFRLLKNNMGEVTNGNKEFAIRFVGR